MGGDHAPGAVVRGALLAIERQPLLDIELVGDEPRLRQVLRELGASEGDRVRLVHAPQVLEMGEHPVAGLRAKPDCSIAMAVRRVGEGEAAAVFSAGNTGGMVAAATLHLQRIRGIKRPGIAVPFPTMTGACLVLDVGANIYCKPVHLLHYGIMANAYARAVLGVEEPRVGILNIGQEEGKGTDLVQETADLLRRSGLRFIGNVEPHQLFQGVADVVVCDGFVGNMVLKTTEGLAECMLALIQGGVKSAARDDPAASAAMGKILGGLQDRVDYTSYGGAPLLGFDGAIFIGHGRSNPQAVASAMRGAHEFVAADVNGRIREAVHGRVRDGASDAHAPVAGG